LQTHMNTRAPLLLIWLVWCVCALCACKADASSTDEAYANDIRSRAGQTQQFLSGNTNDSGPLPSLAQIYAPRNFAPLWIRDGAPTPQSIALIRVLCAAENYGLRSAEYLDCPRFEQVLSASPVAAGALPLANAEFDMGLTTVTLRFLSHIHFGRIDPHRAGFDLDSKRPPLRYAEILAMLSTTNDVSASVASLEPAFEHYNLLKQALLRYRLLAAGQAEPTRAELQSAPYGRRIRQIELTLERWRWLPTFDTPPIIVNIPQFRLFAFETTRDLKSQILQMDVIVGRTFPKLRTPVFAADLKYVIFRPYWDVPYSITQHEMLPDLRSKPDSLRKQHLEIVAGPGDTAPVVPFSQQSLEGLAAGKLRLRQQPGEDNALGLIKFMLPNSYNVYLHSTPAHRLFSQARRAFSHGCIRVSDPAALASYVLRNASGTWTPESIDAAMHGADTLRVNLKTPIRVLILYGTALATEDGAVMFFDDIYGHDRKLEGLLGLPLLTAGTPHTRM
jgi:murein L,D-transpeptidase YcbB/YkuD